MLPEAQELDQEVIKQKSAAMERQETLEKAVEEYDETQEQKKQSLESGENINKDDTHRTKAPEEFGLLENLQEGANVITGAIRDEARNIVTAPERIADMLSGDMERQLAETGKYELDFDFLPDHQQPVTRTKWGNVMRGILGYATFAIPVAGIAGKIGKGTGIAAKAAKATLASKNVFVAGAARLGTRCTG